MPDLLVINGPNLNLLGIREPEHYGADTLTSINARLHLFAEQSGYALNSFQSNSEADLISQIHQAQTDGTRFIIINPAAFTHTSIALRDALSAVKIPFIEIHLSNIHARENFRAHSYFSDIAAGVISGLGAQGYELALQAAISHLQHNQLSQG